MKKNRKASISNMAAKKTQIFASARQKSKMLCFYRRTYTRTLWFVKFEKQETQETIFKVKGRQHGFQHTLFDDKDMRL